jgi:DNA-directed RNA polymerase subunit beta
MTTKTPKTAPKTEKAEKKAPAKSRSSTKVAAADKPVVRYVVEKPIVFKPANDVDSFTGRKRVRRSFGKIREVAQMPNLIEVQRHSYEQFLQAERAGRRPQNAGSAGSFLLRIPDQGFL